MVVIHSKLDVRRWMFLSFSLVGWNRCFLYGEDLQSCGDQVFSCIVARVMNFSGYKAVLSRLTLYFLLLFAGVLYAAGLKYFVFPAQVIPTGTEGIAAAFSYYFEKDWLFLLLYAVFQFSLLSFAYFNVSRRFALRSLAVVCVVLVTLPLLPEFKFAEPEPHNERILLVIFGGLIAGVAKAIAFQQRGSTGDEDILGAYFAMKLLRPVGAIAIVAATVSTAVGLALNLLKNHELEPVVNTLMYTSIYIFVSAEVLNNFYRKFRLSMLSIYTKDTGPIGELIKRVYPHRTYTVQDATGGFSGEPVKVVTTIVTHEELPHLLEAVREEGNCFYLHQELEGVSSRYYIEPIG